MNKDEKYDISIDIAPAREMTSVEIEALASLIFSMWLGNLAKENQETGHQPDDTELSRLSSNK